ncbi:unnamed protein product [Clavelina lepadiformis]|uniref:Uncharacterized protein n=1 Tax=Clavelina lepadiformis TaxID=159417 RepID=A0ABP0GN16_CLALP
MCERSNSVEREWLLWKNSPGSHPDALRFDPNIQIFVFVTYFAFLQRLTTAQDPRCVLLDHSNTCNDSASSVATIDSIARVKPIACKTNKQTNQTT